MNRILPTSTSQGANDATRGPGASMYRFLERTADQYMTRAVVTVTREVTLRELEGLFEKHDFNSFPVVEGGKILGIVTKIRFSEGLRLYHGSDGAALR